MNNKTISTLCIFSILIFSACQSNIKKNKVDIPQVDSSIMSKESQDIPYILAKNYFVKNTVKSIDNPKIDTEEKFNEIFGMATTMGEEGKPTSIDFSKQMVIALVLNETDIETSLSPLQLIKTKKVLSLDYKLVLGRKQSYTSRPFFAIIIDKIETDKIVLNEVK
jgi:hypothetical protein